MHYLSNFNRKREVVQMLETLTIRIVYGFVSVCYDLIKFMYFYIIFDVKRNIKYIIDVDSKKT